MGTNAFIGIDVGSGSVRAGVFGQDGARLAFATRPIRQFHPAPNVVEQSSADIWAQLCAAVREAVAGAGIDPATVGGIGIDATCSLVAVGAGGAPVSVATDGDPARDIVMWMDHRAGAEAAEINATRDPALAYVGGEVSLEMELPKILWLQRHLPDQVRQVRRFFDLADYLVWRATGADVASVCTLTCKWNYLAHEGRFSDTLLRAVGLDWLPAHVPPQIRPLGVPAGGLGVEAATAFGLPAGVPVATGIIDAHAGALALIGAAPEGALAIIAGTSACHMIVSPAPIMVPGVWGPYWGALLPGLWLNEGGQSAAGALLDWTLRGSALWPELEAAARARTATPYDVLNEWVAALEQREPWPTRHLHVLGDHHGNRSPRADAEARGVVVGLTLESGQDTLARLYLATLQGLAYGTRHVIEAMRAAGHRVERLVICGGGTRNPLWLREHADATGCDLQLATDEDAVTLGAALLGAAASGAFPDLPAAAAAMTRPGPVVAARPQARAFHDAKYAVYLALYDEARRHREAMTRAGENLSHS
ncbi:D-ribulokinase [Rhodovastum atsumiense]|uniref:FGGY-family carbohydrate kinase n=1 Tax=Rhodovastum atsumiense TaxID=504468 RepID=A0A5M6IV16_9PROT|nr:FGGY-family carbohydrate kinase [Rhodovastum atsumiense]KAA5612146.1 FGGY-family carbohydrate kinase [Rhodovastum atsumiense]CAH2603909.1 D-ribulokinase [Rhodovastum atsumiense]